MSYYSYVQRCCDCVESNSAVYTSISKSIIYLLYTGWALSNWNINRMRRKIWFCLGLKVLTLYNNKGRRLPWQYSIQSQHPWLKLKIIILVFLKPVFLLIFCLFVCLLTIPFFLLFKDLQWYSVTNFGYWRYIGIWKYGCVYHSDCERI